MPKMQTLIPTRKVTGGALAGAVSTILIAVLNRNDIVVSNDVAVAITTVLTFAVAYFIPPAARDQVVEKELAGGHAP